MRTSTNDDKPPSTDGSKLSVYKQHTPIQMNIDRSNMYSQMGLHQNRRKLYSVLSMGKEGTSDTIFVPLNLKSTSCLEGKVSNVS